MNDAVTVIRLSDAVLCEECQQITVAKNHHCPACGASGECVVRLASFFERGPAAAPREAIRTDSLRFLD